MWKLVISGQVFPLLSVATHAPIALLNTSDNILMLKQNDQKKNP